MKSETISVQGMTCEHCKKRVEAALLSVPGVSAANVRLEDSAVDLSYDPSFATEAMLVAAIEDAGYDVLK